MNTTIYLHSNKEAMYNIAQELGLSEEASKNFKYACYEVAIELEVNRQTGEAKIVAVNGVKHEP